ncbi:hypothetical protein [Paucibacter soli]|uniref:hypothetical protein n=1 Tax=Paucibacter soli TaxID=3133433 RepID=UPI00309FF9F9
MSPLLKTAEQRLGEVEFELNQARAALALARAALAQSQTGGGGSDGSGSHLDPSLLDRAARCAADHRALTHGDFIAALRHQVEPDPGMLRCTKALYACDGDFQRALESFRSGAWTVGVLVDSRPR